MIVTLYKNCILNDRYYEVFDCKVRQENTPSALEQYLATLDTYEFDVENVYISQTGSLVLPLEIPSATFNPLEYNYMKCVNNDNDLITYCFINEVVFGNSVIVVNYKQDVWSNWSAVCNIRQGVFKNLNSLGGISSASLPVDIIQNTWIQPDTIYNPITEQNEDPLNENFNLIVVYQSHDLVTGDNYEVRNQKCAIFGIGQSGTTELDYTLDKNGIGYALSYLLNKENQNCLHMQGQTEIEPDVYGYPDFISFYIIPAIDNITTNGNKYNIMTDETTLSNNWLVDITLENGTFTKTIVEKNYTPAQINQSVVGVGIIDYIIPYNELSKGINLKLELNYDGSSLSILMYAPGIITDVSSAFEIEPMWTAQNDSAIAQRKIQYQMQKQQLITNGYRTFSNGLMSVATNLLGINQASDSGDIYGRKGAILDTLGDINNTVTDLIDIGFKYYYTTRPQYGNFNPAKTSGNPLFNAVVGLKMFIASPVNGDFITSAINNMGYNVQKYVENIDLGLYNGIERLYGGSPAVCSFSYINISGSASQNVLRALETILSKTTKIYYNGTI